MNTIIHVGYLNGQLLLLRKLSPQRFVWFRREENGNEQELPVVGFSIEEALRLARQQWKSDFRLLNCGFRYTLPERDEHGCNALFYQMCASYKSPSGVYFDDELGGNCVVHFASQEARALMQIV